MRVTEAVKTRKSIRAFLEKEVSRSTIETILEAARYAPSGVNMQPWEVLVVSGAQKKAFDAAMQQAFDNEEPEEMAYTYYPTEWFEPYRSRRVATGKLLYETLGIERADKDAQTAQWRANYRAFDAPAVLLFLMDKRLGVGSFLDYGMFMQSVMLLANEAGLATCPQAALAQYPQVVDALFTLPENMMVVAGIALGYEDREARINSFRPPRREVEEFARFFVDK